MTNEPVAGGRPEQVAPDISVCIVTMRQDGGVPPAYIEDPDLRRAREAEIDLEVDLARKVIEYAGDALGRLTPPRKPLYDEATGEVWAEPPFYKTDPKQIAELRRVRGDISRDYAKLSSHQAEGTGIPHEPFMPQLYMEPLPRDSEAGQG